MTDDGNFLTRWSRRKRDAALNTREQSAPNITADGAAPSDAAAVPSAPSEIAPPFDRSSLPSIESIDAKSDIHAFLSAGVPADLARAALRRAWSSDPTIRDFVGLSENSWDFNAPGGVPGFGAVKIEDIRQLLAEFAGESQAPDDTRASLETPPIGQTTILASELGPAAAEPTRQSEAQDPAHDQLNPEHDTRRGHGNPAHRREAKLAGLSRPENPIPPLRRHVHGGALPQ